MSRFSSSSVRTEGGLLPQDLLGRIHSGDPEVAGTQAESYHLGPTERIGEAVNRAWSDLLVRWRTFQELLGQEPEGSLATRLTRERWLLPLFNQLGYGWLPKSKAIEVDGKRFAISHIWHNSPIHLLGARTDLETRAKGVAGAAKASPHGIVQEFLNRTPNYLWGIVTNGLKLRVLRDHHSLTRQAFIEFDLEMIMDGEQYSDFLLLWLICHQSRLEAEEPSQCWLETWKNTSQKEGVRALDKLRVGVEKAIESFGTGFLKHKANKALKSALESGALDKQDYYRQLLRLVYRAIFLFVAEDRDALLDPGASEETKEKYRRYYSTSRLRSLAAKSRGGPHGDLWRGLAIVMEKLDDGFAGVGLPALGSRLWSSSACPDLMASECSNTDILEALRHLCYIRDGRVLYPVNWRSIGADELGSVYESLLERHPCLNKEAGSFHLETSAGNERKTSGSYYTPTSLVDCLLDSALDPVLDGASAKPDPEAAILNLKVCDPACGSGHFLVAAARRIAKRLASVRSGDDEPSPSDVQHALRDVVRRCIFGVDINPMSVELCKVSLWMETIDPGKPLSFLDNHILCGNALLGATPALMSRGIPTDAFTLIHGDDNEVVKRLRERNRTDLTGQTSLTTSYVREMPSEQSSLVKDAYRLEMTSEENISLVREKAQEWDRLSRSASFRDAWFRADAWCTAFVWPKHDDVAEDSAITHSVWREIEADVTSVGKFARRTIRESAQKYAFFHWHLAFPQVFGETKPFFDEDDVTGWIGGFDLIIGNPPWERIKLQEQEWFAARAPEIADAPNKSAREKLIADLQNTEPALAGQWEEAKRTAEGVAALIRNGGQYPLCGRGDINTSSVFAELGTQLISGLGRTGLIVPTGIATDDTTKFFFQNLMDNATLDSLFDFSNDEGLFPSVRPHQHFCLLTVLGCRRKAIDKTKFAFFLKKPSELPAQESLVRLNSEDIAAINPNSKTLPVFTGTRDAAIVKDIYERTPVLINEAKDSNPWEVEFLRMFDMANDSSLFRLRSDLVAKGVPPKRDPSACQAGGYHPLFDAKMAGQFSHRAASLAPSGHQFRKLSKVSTTEEELNDPLFCPEPAYWVASEAMEARLPDWKHPWLLGFKDVTGVTSIRMAQFAFIPLQPATHKFPLTLLNRGASDALALASVLNSILIEFVLRQKMQGVSLTYFILKQLPVPHHSSLSVRGGWTGNGSLIDWLAVRALELSFTSWSLTGLAREAGFEGPPFRWSENRRHQISAEIDAAIFCLYELKREDVEFVLDRLDKIQRQDEKRYGDYRTKLLVLEAYDSMQECIVSGEPYQSIIEPSPGDTSMTHPESTKPDWLKT